MTRDNLPTAADLPSFTQFVSIPHASLPVHYLAINEPRFVRDYVCGEFYGFITNVALSGTYRQQNTRYFERYGYRPEKWPYVPLRGQIVTDLRHQVLEIYESLYQFTTPWAAGVFLSHTGSSVYPEHRIPVRLAPGAVVTEMLLGPDPATDEHAILIAVPDGIYAIELAIQGGRSLDWADVQRYWKMLAALVPALGG